MPNKQVCVIGTSMSNQEDFKRFFKELDPSIRFNEIADDSLIQDLLANQGPTPSTIKRLCNYAQMAEEMGACQRFGVALSLGATRQWRAKCVGSGVGYYR